MKDMDGLAELKNIPSPRRNLRKRMIRQGSVSENYFAIQDAALILPRQSTLAPVEVVEVKKLSHIQSHLHAIFDCLRDQDSVKLAVRLESWNSVHIRYLVIVSMLGRQDTEESIIVGMDFDNTESCRCTIGLVLPIWSDSVIAINGDGGFKVTSHERTIIFKPVSVQAMWSALQCLHKCRDVAIRHNYYRGSLFLTWISFYESHVNSDRIYLNEWEYIDELWTRRPNYFEKPDSEREEIEGLVRNMLRQVMMNMDLDNSTSRQIREALEGEIDRDLREYKTYIDEQMLVVLGQMDCPSKITDFLYLGSQWNASNFDELKEIGITHILNVTKEIDSFYPEDFKYKRISLFDVPTSELLPHWNDTWRFIDSSRRHGGKCLVHCKMGISRSSSTVAAFLMKQNLWRRDDALKYVKDRRGIICPNEGFMCQLHEYEGIIFASAQRHNKLFRSRSESNLIDSTKTQQSAEVQSHMTQQNNDDDAPHYDLHRHLLDIATMQKSPKPTRPKSWSPGDTELYYTSESVTVPSVGPWSLVSNVTEVSDVLPSFTPIDHKKFSTEHTSSDHKMVLPRFQRRKFKRRHTELMLPTRTEIVHSEDSVFVNPGEPTIPIHETWASQSHKNESPKKTARQSSSPAVLGSVQEDNLIIESIEEDDLDLKKLHEKHLKDLNDNIDTSSNIDNVKNFVARIDSTEPDVPQVKGHKKTASASNATEFITPDELKVSRERSFSETQALSVKNIVNKIETQYSVPVAEPETNATVTRSHSMPARSRHVKSPPLSILPSIDDVKTDISSEFSDAEPVVSEHCDVITNTNSNNNNNHKMFEPTSPIVVAIPDKIYEKDPMDCAIRTFTKDELQIIREVGQTLLSDSALSQDGSADSAESGMKKRGIVRQMAKEIEKKIRKIIDQNTSSPLKSKHKKLDEENSMAHVNKLLMGQVSPETPRKTSVKKSKQAPRRINSTPNFSRLLAPIPFSRERIFQRGVKLNNRRNSDVTKGITRSQSERTGIKFPRVSFRNKKLSSLSSRNSFSESELNESDIFTDPPISDVLKTSKSEPDFDAEIFHPVQVKEMVQNIEKGKQVQRSRSLNNKQKSDV